MAAGDSPIQARGILPFDGARLASQAPGGEGNPSTAEMPHESLSKLPLSSNSGGGTVRMVLMHMRSFQMTNVDAKIVHTG